MGVLKVNDENNRIRIRIRSHSHRHGSPVPDPYQNVTDPQHLFSHIHSLAGGGGGGGWRTQSNDKTTGISLVVFPLFFPWFEPSHARYRVLYIGYPLRIRVFMGPDTEVTLLVESASPRVPHP
jgi:hypothetical protein